MEIYTDGSCLGNPGPGGWAWYNVSTKEKQNGIDYDTTNQRMELRAVCEALEAVIVSVSTPLPPITIVTDSAYVKNGITTWIHAWKRNGWMNSKGVSVKNQDLWKVLDELTLRPHFQSPGHLTWKWVKAHAKSEANKLVDGLARSAAHAAKTHLLDR